MISKQEFEFIHTRGSVLISDWINSFIIGSRKLSWLFRIPMYFVKNIWVVSWGWGEKSSENEDFCIFFFFRIFRKMLIWRSDLEELEYPEHLENLINRKITIFYIEAVSQNFFSTPKKKKFSNLEQTKNIFSKKYFF